MTTTRPLLHALAALLAAGAACGPAGPTGTMSVHLVDAPGDYLEVNLHVAKVEILNDASGWTTLGTPDVTVNLLGLTGGVAATLVHGATLPAGSYGQLRLVLGAGNTVKLLDGSVHDLTVPSGLRTGVKLIVHFDVQAGTTRDVYVDFDAHRSVWLHGAGASGQYILRPVVRAVDKLATGAIAGKLSGQPVEGSAAPLAGVVVTAQELDAGGNATVVRSVRTGADGSYQLDLLPAGGSYHVVSQPVLPGEVYLPKASGAIAITAAAPIGAFDATFTQTTSFGGVTGRVTPPAGANDVDLVEVRQPLDAGGTPRTFVVRTAQPAVAAGVESYLVDQLPAGSWSLSVQRRTIDLAGNETTVTGAAASSTVAAGATTTTNLTVP